MPARKLSVYAGRSLERLLKAAPNDAPGLRINAIADRYEAMVGDLARTIPLSRAEWNAVMDALNGVADHAVAAGYLIGRNAILATIADARHIGPAHGIDHAALMGTLAGLSEAQVMTILELSERVWARADEPVAAILEEAIGDG